MDIALFYNTLRKNFPYQLTFKQDVFFQKLAAFVLNPTNDELFVLRGYAGTGKTTLIATLVHELSSVGYKHFLLAPTGRAAKVMANYSNTKAFTIHKKIYFPAKTPQGGIHFTLQKNKHKNTLFIVDESSMISSTALEFGRQDQNSVLDDLVSYVYGGTNCKLLLIGDTAQLPPVNQ
jgi:ATP-dependent exoDNAse (exonuclease V) alpha subunit